MTTGHPIHSAQPTCWYVDDTCPECGNHTVATDGEHKWCTTCMDTDEQPGHGRREVC